MNTNYKIVSIEGNIGSGKSTLLEHLKQHYSNNSKVIFLREPVSDWEKIVDKNGDTMLKKFYSDQEKYSFAFQMMAYISRLSILRSTIDSIKDRAGQFVIITERCLYTDKHVFAKMLFDQGKIEDVCYQIYRNWFDEFALDYDIDTIIYVKTNPENCYNRVNKRLRNGEESIPISYLECCHQYHEDYVYRSILVDTLNDKLVMDGNNDIYVNPNVMKEWIEKIDSSLFIYRG